MDTINLLACWKCHTVAVVIRNGDLECKCSNCCTECGQADAMTVYGPVCLCYAPSPEFLRKEQELYNSLTPTQIEAIRSQEFPF